MGTWKTLSIFVSSTFNDMQAERDYIRKYVVPRLEKDLESYQVMVKIIDLRWGVDTRIVDEEQRESKVLHVCLDTIRHTRPFFIGLLGDRYGWIPSKERWDNVYHQLDMKEQELLRNGEGKSVTEMEILFGAIGAPSILPHSLFYFRKPESYDNMPASLYPVFRDSMQQDSVSKHNSSKLEILKRNIINVCNENDLPDNCSFYTAKWNVEKKHFGDLKRFGDKVYTDLMREITEELSLDEDEALPDDKQELKVLDAFVESRTAFFVGREELINRMMGFLGDRFSVSDKIKSHQGYILTGFSGCGKSSVFSMLYRSLEEKSRKISLIVLAHASGITSSSILIDVMIGNWCRKLEEILGVDPSVTCGESELKKLILRAQTKGYSIVALIDSLDSFISLPKSLDFIPLTVPFVCTSLPEVIEKYRDGKVKVKIMSIELFTRREAELFIEGTLAQNNKELPAKLQEKLLSVSKENGEYAFSSPLWLKLGLSILMELGENDFKEIHLEKLEHEDEKIEFYLSRLIDSFPSESAALFMDFVHLTAQYFDKDITYDILSYLALSRFGLRESDLEILMGDKWNQLEFTSICYWFRRLMDNNNIEENWRFSHNVLKNALLTWDESYLDTRLTKLIAYLVEKIQLDSKLKIELLYQIFTHNLTDEFYKQIEEDNLYPGDPEFVNLIMSENKEDILCFLKQYISEYYKDGCSWIVDFTSVLFSEVEYNILSEKSKFGLQILQMWYDMYTEDNLQNGDRYLIKDYCDLVHQIIEFYQENDRSGEICCWFEKEWKVYVYKKEQFGMKFFDRNLIHSFFRDWGEYIWCRSNLEFDEEWSKNEIEKYYKEIVLFYEINGHSLGRVDPFYKLVRLLKRLKLPADFKSLYYASIHKGLYEWWVSAYNNNEYYAEDIAKTLIRYIKDYNDNCNRLQNKMTETMLLIKKNGAKLGGVNFENYLYTSKPKEINPEPEKAIEEEKVGVISRIQEGGDDWNEIFNEKDWDEEEFEMDNMEEDTVTELNMEQPEIGEIEKAANVLDEMISNLDMDADRYEDESRQLFINLFEQAKLLADLYRRNQESEKAIRILETICSIQLNCIIDLYENYMVWEKDVACFLELCNFYESAGYTEKIPELLTSLCRYLHHSFLHHIDGDVHHLIYHTLLDWYDKYGKVQEKTDLLEKIFELSFMYHYERPFDDIYLFYRDLGYVRPRYSTLLDLYKKNGEIEKTVILLERWIQLCRIAYTDDMDSRDAYDDVEDVYDTLGQLYDGTPLFLKGMRERHSLFLEQRCIMAYQNGKCGYLSPEGEVLLPFEYDWGWAESCGTVSVCKNKKWGYISLTGKSITDLMFDVATPISDGSIFVRMNGHDFYWKSGENPIEITQLGYAYKGRIKEGLLRVFKYKPSWKVDFVTSEGKLLFDFVFSYVYTPNRGTIVVRKNRSDDFNPMMVYGLDGRAKTEKQYRAIVPFGNEEITLFKDENSKIGFIDREGNEVVPARYTCGRQVSEGFAAVSMNISFSIKRWGFIDVHGNEIVQPIYNDVGDFHEGLAWVCLGARDAYYGFRNLSFGFIDKSGDLVIPMLFEDVCSFYNGKALVCKKDEMFYINRNGERIADF